MLPDDASARVRTLHPLVDRRLLVRYEHVADGPQLETALHVPLVRARIGVEAANDYERSDRRAACDPIEGRPKPSDVVVNNGNGGLALLPVIVIDCH